MKDNGDYQWHFVFVSAGFEELICKFAMAAIITEESDQRCPVGSFGTGDSQFNYNTNSICIFQEEEMCCPSQSARTMGQMYERKKKKKPQISLSKLYTETGFDGFTFSHEVNGYVMIY